MAIILTMFYKILLRARGSCKIFQDPAQILSVFRILQDPIWTPIKNFYQGKGSQKSNGSVVFKNITISSLKLVSFAEDGQYEMDSNLR